MGRRSIDPSGSVVITTRVSAPVALQIDELAMEVTRASGAPTTRSDIVRVILTPPFGISVVEAHGARITEAFEATRRALVRAIGSMSVGPRKDGVAASGQAAQAQRERLTARIRELLGALRPGRRFLISRMSSKLGRPRHELLLEVLRDLERKKELELRPPELIDTIQPYHRRAAVRDPLRGDLVYVVRPREVARRGKPRLRGKPRRAGKPRLGGKRRPKTKPKSSNK